MKKTTPQIIYIEEGQEIAHILDYIVRSQSQTIYLVVPDGIPTMKNFLNLKLLKHEADASRKSITIVTQDPLIERLSKRSGFETKENLPPYLDEYRPGLRIEAKDEEKNDLMDDTSPRKVQDIIPPESKRELVPTKMPLREPEEIQVERGPEELKEQTGELEEEPEGRKSELEEEISEEEFPAPTKFKKEAVFTKKKEIVEKLVNRLKRGIPLKLIFPQFINKIFLIFIGVSIVIAIFVAYLILPKVKVVIIPRKEMLSFDLESRASSAISQINFSGSEIPAQLINIEKSASKEFLSSGKELRKEKARGVVTIYNEYSSSPQTLVEQTRLVSQDGKLFRITETIIVPGATVDGGKIIPSSIDVNLIAAETGGDYNIGPSTFSVPGFKGTPKYNSFYGKSKTAMSGGFEGEVNVVTQEDLERAKSSFVSELSDLTKEEFSSKIPEDLKLLDEARSEEIFEVQSDKQAGEVAERFKIEGKAKITAILFRESDVQNLIENALTKRLSQDKKTIPESQTISYSVSNLDFEKGITDLSLHVEELVLWQVPIDEIKENLAGKNEEEVRKYLSSQPQIENAKITFWPFWVKRVPITKDKIKIEIKS